MLSVCGEVVGGSDDDTFSEVTAVVMLCDCCVVVEGCGVLVAVFTGGKLTSFLVVTATLVGFAGLTGVVITCSRELVLPAKEQSMRKHEKTAFTPDKDKASGECLLAFKV